MGLHSYYNKTQLGLQSHYPAFKNATVAQIYNVEQLDPQQFFWPDLDVDIELGALQHPEQFPLQFKIAT